MHKTRFLSAIITLLIAYLALNWFLSDKTGAAKEPSHDSALTVSVIFPNSTAIHERINVTGTTIPREAVVVISELSAVRIVEVLADVGDVVNKDQILARLDSASLSNQFEQLKKDYEGLYDQFKRVDAIKNTGYISEEILVQKRTVMEAAKAKLADAELNLQRATITAPVAGIIFERNATIGALVSVNEPLYRIARDGEIEIEAQIPEAQLSKLQLNQDAVIVVSGRTTPIQGKVRLITPQINNASRTASIRIALGQAEDLPIGLFAHVEIELGKTTGLLLPATALQQDTTGFFVWGLDKGNTTVRIPVEVVLRNDEGILVRELSFDGPIVARAGVFLKEGERVNVVEQK